MTKIKTKTKTLHADVKFRTCVHRRDCGFENCCRRRGISPPMFQSTKVCPHYTPSDDWKKLHGN